jgi:hypothetical protein
MKNSKLGSSRMFHCNGVNKLNVAQNTWTRVLIWLIGKTIIDDGWSSRRNSSGRAEKSDKNAIFEHPLAIYLVINMFVHVKTFQSLQYGY